MVNDFKQLFKDINFILKLVEFIICVVAWVMMYIDPPGHVMHGAKHDCIPVAICGYGAVALCCLIAYIFDEINKLLEICLTIFGAFYHLLAAIFIFIYHGDYEGSMRGSDSFFWILLGVLTLACCAVCIADVVLKIIKK